jgi:hypothetical protein
LALAANRSLADKIDSPVGDMASPSLPFEDWKLRLHQDCELKQKLPTFDALSDIVLKLFWNEGIEPTIDELVGNSRRVFFSRH